MTGWFMMQTPRTSLEIRGATRYLPASHYLISRRHSGGWRSFLVDCSFAGTGSPITTGRPFEHSGREN